MSSAHTFMLLDVATRVAQRVRTDPYVANSLDPVIFIAAYDEGCNVTHGDPSPGRR
jgi:hypothetical protein